MDEKKDFALKLPKFAPLVCYLFAKFKGHLMLEPSITFIVKG